MTDKQKELADYQAEVLRVIRGESSFSRDTLTGLIDATEQEADRLAGIYGGLQNELAEAEQAAEAEIEEYKQLSDWASLYKQCSFEAKKMIVSRLVKSVHVYREYHIDIEFNVSFEEFRQLEIDGKSLPADPAQGIEKQA